MRKYSGQQIWSVGFMLMLVAGCAARPPLSAEVPQTVSKARAYYEVVTNLGVEKKYPNDYQEAEEKLVEAETFLNSPDKQEKALSPAQASLSASQRMLKYFYSNTISPLARKAQAEIEKITAEDPDNPLKDFLPTINDLLAYSDKLESGQNVIALDRVINDLTDVLVIKHNADRNVNVTLLSDVSFDSGKYDLSEAGKRLLSEFFERVIAEQKEELRQYTGKVLTMKIRVLGYTDQQGFRKGTELIKALAKDVEAQVPQAAAAQRQFLNQRLALFRAATLCEYIQQFIAQKDASILIEVEKIGRGEEFPPGVSKDSAAGSPNDARRRICKIYSYVLIR